MLCDCQNLFWHHSDQFWSGPLSPAYHTSPQSHYTIFSISAPDPFIPSLLIVVWTFVVHLPYFPFQNSLRRYHGPASDAHWTSSLCFLYHMTSLNVFLIQHHFHFGLLLVYVPMSPSLLSFVSRYPFLLSHIQFPFVPHLWFPCFKSTCIPHFLTCSLQHRTPHRLTHI